MVHIPLVRIVKLNFLHNSQWITLYTQSCLVLYSFWGNLLHSLMWLIVSSLSPHNLHLLFYCVLSILALIWMVLKTLFCAAIRRDSVLLLRFPFLNHVHVFLCEILLNIIIFLLLLFLFLFLFLCLFMTFCISALIWRGDKTWSLIDCSCLITECIFSTSPWKCIRCFFFLFN